MTGRLYVIEAVFRSLFTMDGEVKSEKGKRKQKYAERSHCMKRKIERCIDSFTSF
jgi:hypothetical protein